jgi:phosphoglycolate phosphatase
MPFPAEAPFAVFDFDGTLVDSRAIIQQSMESGFRALGLEPPAYEQTRKIVGLSLAEAIHRIAPHLTRDDLRRLAEHYKAAFQERRQDPAFKEPLYDGAAATLTRLRASGWRIGGATGKSRRGVDFVLERHGLADLFDTVWCADDGPGKPDPHMVLGAMRTVGAQTRHTVVIGDTSFDIEMANRAGATAIGVTWGFHTPDEIAVAGPQEVHHDFDMLNSALDRFAARLGGHS